MVWGDMGESSGSGSLRGSLNPLYDRHPGAGEMVDSKSTRVDWPSSLKGMKGAVSGFRGVVEKLNVVGHSGGRRSSATTKGSDEMG
jgi:hypothetical protein